MDYSTMEDLMEMDERMNITSVADFFGVREATIYSWIKRKPEFPVRGEDGRWSGLEINIWAARHAIPTRRR